MRMRSIRAVLFAFAVLILSTASFGQVRISVRFGPPLLPVYDQPLCPGDGYIWTPGYWAWSEDDSDYYWVPGTWVLAPEVGYLWTPPFWGWESGAFLFHEGYWGPHVGFYGGVNYGFGYFGDGFAGGRWDRDHFYYNRSVTNVNVTNIHNVYNETVVNNRTVINRVSYNGGDGGITRRPTPQEENAERERHIRPPAPQLEHMQAARGNPELRATANHGRPPVAATSRPGDFKREAVPAREAGGPYNPPANRGGNERAAQPGGGNGGNLPARIVHPKDIPQSERPAYTSSGNEKQDKKYQQQQEKLQQQQANDRQKLQQKQDQEHQRMTQQKTNEARQQQVEQKHQQQTQQLQQRHQQQQQKMQQRQAPPQNRPQAEKPKN